MIEKEMTLTKFYASILNLQRTKYLVSKSSLLPEKMSMSQSRDV